MPCFALSIDVSMDAVAYRLHMWTWNWSSTGLNPLTAQWFGVPYANFCGWLYVVFFYSAFSRLLNRWLIKNGAITKIKFAVIPLLSVLLSQVALWVTMVDLGDFQLHHGISDGFRLTYTLLILALVIIVSWRKKKIIEEDQPLVAWLVPVWFHVYFFALLFIGGFYKETRWLVVAGSVVFIFGLMIHVRKNGAKGLQPVQYG